MKTISLIIVFAIGILSCTTNTNDEAAAPASEAGCNGAYSSLITKTTAYPSAYETEAAHRGRIERIDYDTRDYAEGTDRAIGGFSIGGVTTWYALAETFQAFKYYLPISSDCWSLGTFAGMNRPTQTAQYLANVISQSPYADDFYIWAASGTNDSAYSETLLQVRSMAQLTDIFGLNHLSFHEKEYHRVRLQSDRRGDAADARSEQGEAVLQHEL